jgi:superfamily I DNA/RNA helicase
MKLQQRLRERGVYDLSDLLATRDERLEAADRIDALDALCDGLTTTAELLARLESLFSDDQTTRRLMFSSVHRAKGLESDRVFVLIDTFRGGSVEEENLWYVAVTRSKRHLFLVGGLP